MKRTYKESEKLLIDAYNKNSIEILKAGWCPCGILSDHFLCWRMKNPPTFTIPYSYQEYIRIEKAMFRPFSRYYVWQSLGNVKQHFGPRIENEQDIPEYEDLMYKGLKSVLVTLHMIHINRGETPGVITEFPQLKLK